MTSTCNICPRNCNADRNKKCGFCHASEKMMVAHFGLHFGEEPCISGTAGSGTIFFCNCNLKCKFCQNDILRDGSIGKEISVLRFVEIVKQLEAMGANNINLVSPMHYVPQIVEAFKIYRPKIPVVYNTNAYEKIETLKQIAPFVDVFLPDLKYFDSELSGRLSLCKNYFEVASKAILFMRQQKPVDVFENGLMKSGVIVRHLVLPNHTNDSIKIVDFINQNLNNTIVSLMSQYVPYGEAKNMPDINRTLKPIEYNKVLRHLEKNHTGQIYCQDPTSATEEYIPHWNPSAV